MSDVLQYQLIMMATLGVVFLTLGVLQMLGIFIGIGFSDDEEEDDEPK